MIRLVRYLFALAALVSASVLITGVSNAAEESPAAPAEATKYYVDDIKASMMQHVKENIDDQGVFRLKDDKTGEMLELKFVRIHDPVRQIGSDIYFACTDFHVVGDEDKLYDLDFWMNADTGELRVYDSKVHKEPRWSLLYGWYKQPRYTFVDDEIEYLY